MKTVRAGVAGGGREQSEGQSVEGGFLGQQNYSV